MGNEEVGNVSDYELKIDAQVEKFLEMKQKLTYFLITASVAVIAFLASFTVDHRDEILDSIWLIIISSIFGLATAGSSLLNLHLEHKSYKLHIKYRYKEKSFKSLEENEQARWDKINEWAAFMLKCAFSFLFIEIGLAVVFFIIFFS